MSRALVAAAVVALLAAGCRKKVESIQPDSLGTGPTSEAFQRPEVVGPVHWWDQSGLCLDVPDGWKGEGLGRDGLLLTLEEVDSGVRFEVFRAEAARDRAHLTPILDDPGTYRDIPVLGPVGVESWISDVPGGPTLHVWNASVRDTPIRVEARYPFGKTFTGMLAVEELLRALCVE